MTSTDVAAAGMRTLPLVFDPLRIGELPHGTRIRVDREGGAPLRCCLRDSRPGERIALIAATPEGPRGAYRETGPVFVHADPCSGPAHPGYPDDFRRRAQVFRAYDWTGAIAGGAVIPAGEGQEEAARQLLRDPSIAFVQTRNVVHGCYMLTIRRA
jgi:hypothetical protein